MATQANIKVPTSLGGPKAQTVPAQVATVGDALETEEARQFTGKSPMETKPIVNGGTRERLAPGTDAFTLGERTRTRLKLEDGTKLPAGGQIKYVLDTHGPKWNNLIAGDRVGQVLDHNDGAQVVMQANGQPLRNIDTMAVWVPQEVIDQNEADERERAIEFAEQAATESLPGTFDPSDQNYRKELRDFNSDLLNTMGIGRNGGSPTAGMSLENAMRLYSGGEIKQQRDEARNPGRSYQEVVASASEKIERAERNQSGNNPRAWGGIGDSPLQKKIAAGKR